MDPSSHLSNSNACLGPFISSKTDRLIGEDFQDLSTQTMKLVEGLSTFKYFNTTAANEFTMEVNTLVRIFQPKNQSTHSKRYKSNLYPSPEHDKNNPKVSRYWMLI